ncbi:MAG: hypothetical protein GY943_21290 [Chloroflexi bacterium]|nr:hypothetical protein [Chloroflexota bacterium]
MAKKRNQDNQSENRQSRRDILLARKQAEQMRGIRIGVGIVVGLLALVLIFAVVNEYIVAPNRAIATVNGEDISLKDWQNRVRLERAQRIILLENQLVAFGGDVGIIQQFSQQAIIELQQTEDMGQSVLNAMVDEIIVQQAAAERGIVISDADLDKEIASLYNYFGGELPTPLPEPTNTVMPTPSITPLPTAVITEVLPTATIAPTNTPGSTVTPAPTATPVSQESFDEQYSELLSRLSDMGVSEETFRKTILAQMYREELTEALAIEAELSDEADHASFFVLSYGTEQEAIEALALIESDGYLTVWNTVRGLPLDPESASTGSASEVVWRTEEAISASAGAAVAEAAFAVPLDTASDLIVEPIDTETNAYYIIRVTGREVRPLADAELDNAKAQNVSNFLAGAQVSGVELTGFDRGRVPTQPVLDPLFTAPPTATPELPEIEVPEIPVDPEGE